MKELLKKIEELENKLSDLKQEANNYSDGYKYVAELFCYGSKTEYTFKNEYATQELCDEYYGDNGIVHVYTDNPNHTISNRGGDVIVIEPHIAVQFLDNQTLHVLNTGQMYCEENSKYEDNEAYDKDEYDEDEYDTDTTMGSLKTLRDLKTALDKNKEKDS